jgi:hypothetical protein
MTIAEEMSPRFKARLAGFFYVLMLPIGAIQTAFGRLPASSDAASYAANILAHPSAVYAAFATDLLVVASYLVVTALFYQLFKPVSSQLSLTAAFFSLTGCATQACASLFRIAPLALLTGAGKQDSVVTLASLLPRLYRPAYSIAMVFFGFYLVLIGCLIFRSTFMPRLIGILVVLAGLGGTTFLWPPLSNALWPKVILSLIAAGEGSMMLWLLIVGVSSERWLEQAAKPPRLL